MVSVLASFYLYIGYDMRISKHLSFLVFTEYSLDISSLMHENDLFR